MKLRLKAMFRSVQKEIQSFSYHDSDNNIVIYTPRVIITKYKARTVQTIRCRHRTEMPGYQQSFPLVPVPPAAAATRTRERDPLSPAQECRKFNTDAHSTTQVRSKQWWNSSPFKERDDQVGIPYSKLRSRFLR